MNLTPSSKTSIGYAIALCFLVIFVGCRQDKPDTENPFYTNPADYDFQSRPELLQRIIAGPHGYFRLINAQFSQEVCRRFEASDAESPSLNLHGDAHLEQYAVTGTGRGLTDFDDSSTGPASIDLVRIGASINLACRQLGWEGNFEQVYDTLLDGYKSGLNDPTRIPDDPGLVRRIRARFKSDKEKFFEWIDSVMAPLPETEKKELFEAMRSYRKLLLPANSKLDERYFEVVKIGHLRMGIGSARDSKYVLRIRGKSDAANDDVILEAKEVRDISGAACMTDSPGSNPLRVLIGQVRIAYQPFDHLGYFQFGEKTYWVHSWVSNYQELAIDKSFASLDDLLAIAFDIGVQLGRGHCNQIADPFGDQLRKSQLTYLSNAEAKLKQASIELAQQTIDAWERFCSEASAH